MKLFLSLKKIISFKCMPNKSKRFGIFLALFIILSLLPLSCFFSGEPPANCLLAQATDQVDPFYLELLEDGKYFYNSANYPEAIKKFEIAFFGLLDNPPRLLECYIYLTACYYLTKNIEKSNYYYNEIKRLKLKDHMKDVKVPEGLLDKYYEIVTYFSRFEPQTPSTSIPFQTKPASPPTRESIQEEIKQLKRAIKNNPKNMEAYFRLCSIYIEQRKIKEAKSLLEDLLEVDPKNGFAYFELGKISLAEKKERDALLNFQKAAPFLPENIELHYELGKLYYELKDYEKARLEFEEVKKINENYRETKEYLALLEKKVGIK